LHDVAHAEPQRDAFHILGRVAEHEGRTTRNDEQPARPGEPCHDVEGKAVGHDLTVLVAAEQLKGQND